MIQKELMRNFVVTLLILIGTSLSIMSIKALGMASSGAIDAKDVVIYSLLLALRQLPIILCISLLISIVSGLSRLGNDSEMVILSTSGWGPVNTLLPVMKYSAPIIGSIFLLAIFVWPIGSQSLQELRDYFSSKAEYQKVQPGVFSSSKSKNQVIFAGVNSGSDLQDIFLFKNEFDSSTITKSESGKIISIDSNPWVLFDSGNTIKTKDNGEKLSITEFRSSGTQLENNSKVEIRDIESNRKSTYELITIPTPKNLSELSWRIGLVIASFNFALAGILFPTNNQRLGKSGNFILALLTFILYMNLIILGQRYIQTNKFGFIEYNMALHLSFFSLICLGIVRRQYSLK